MAPSTELVERVRDALAQHPPVREVRMFGGLAFMVNERMAVCARSGDELLVRADPERADELLALVGASPAEMGAGRAMGASWISVSPAAVGSDEGLSFWLGVALEYNDKQVGTPAGPAGKSKRA